MSRLIYQEVSRSVHLNDCR